MKTKPNRSFAGYIRERVQREPELGRIILARAIENFNKGDLITGKAMLEDYIEATVGFDALGKAFGKSPGSIKRMLGNGSNPRIADLFAVIDHLRKAGGVEIEVSCKSAKPRKRADRRAAEPKPAGEMALA